MGEDPHSEHSPPSSRQGLADPPPTSFGNLYPTGDIVAVIDDRAEAERAAGALADDGIPAGDISLLAGDWVVELDRNLDERQSLLERAMSSVSFVLSDDHRYREEYLQEARKGNQLLFVHAPGPEVQARAWGILRAHHAHHAHHYGTYAVEDLL